jgi:hypothetical protein
VIKEVAFCTVARIHGRDKKRQRRTRTALKCITRREKCADSLHFNRLVIYCTHAHVHMQRCGKEKNPICANQSARQTYTYIHLICNSGKKIHSPPVEFSSSSSFQLFSRQSFLPRPHTHTHTPESSEFKSRFGRFIFVILFKKATASTFFMSTVAGGDGTNYAVNLINMLETRIHNILCADHKQTELRVGQHCIKHTHRL